MKTALPLELWTERDLSSAVVELARLGGWTHRYHTFNSKRSAYGFPDWVLCKPGRLLFLELKSEKGTVKREQTDWIEALKTVPGVDARIVRPSDWDAIVETLTGRFPVTTESGPGKERAA